MKAEPTDLSISAVRWQLCYRIIPSRFPPIQLFEKVARPEDLDAVFQIEALTNDRLREEAGDLTLVPVDERIAGPGSSFVMSAFTHVHPTGGRFTDGTFGAYYAARDRPTAIRETVHHRECFLREMAAPPTEVDMRVLHATLRAELHDVRGQRDRYPGIYAPDDYTHSQALARRLRDAGSRGIVYDSVRRAGGECAAAFRPRALSSCRQAAHLGYVWDGSSISLVYEKRILER